MTFNTAEGELTILILAGIGAMALQSLLIVFFYTFYRRRFKKQAQQLDFYEEKLVNAAVITQEEERRRISRDLHDVIGVQLSASKMYLGQLSTKLDPQKFAKIQAESKKIIDTTIENIRQIIYDITPTELARFGLVPVMEEFIDYLSIDEVKILLESNEQIRFGEQQELAVFRIIQELIHNSLKHAEASKISIQLKFQTKKVELHYVDDGKGFDVSTMVNAKEINKSLGLKSIRSRISFLEAKYTLRSQPNKGFKFSMSIRL